MSNISQNRQFRNIHAAKSGHAALDVLRDEERQDLMHEARALLAAGCGQPIDTPQLAPGADRQAMLVRDSMSVLTQRVVRVKIMLTMLTDGRARESLSESEADELDWMLFQGLEAIEQAVGGVGAALLNAEVRA